jgi:hypothetical protein
LANFMRLSLQKAAYVAVCIPRCRKSRSAPVGMTNLRAVAYVDMGGGGWTESKKASLDKFYFQPSLRRLCGSRTQ